MSSSFIRISAASVAMCVLVSGCAAPYENDPSLTPAQNALREHAAKWADQSGTLMAEGAALLGGLAALGVGLGTGSAKNAALAGAAGAMLGAGVGALVADRAHVQQMNEDQINQAIEGTQKNLAQTQNDIDGARQDLMAARLQIAQLKAQLAKGEITTNDYNLKTDRYRQEAKNLTRLSEATRLDAENMATVAREKKNTVAQGVSQQAAVTAKQGHDIAAALAQLVDGPQAPAVASKA